MSKCKKCSSASTTKNGYTRGKQRYKCKDCGYNFITGDDRENSDILRKAFALIIYCMDGMSYKKVANIFDVTPAAVFKWMKSDRTKLKQFQNDSCSISTMESNKIAIMKKKLGKEVYATLLISKSE